MLQLLTMTSKIVKLYFTEYRRVKLAYLNISSAIFKSESQFFAHHVACQHHFLSFRSKAVC